MPTRLSASVSLLCIHPTRDRRASLNCNEYWAVTACIIGDRVLFADILTFANAYLFFYIYIVIRCPWNGRVYETLVASCTVKRKIAPLPRAGLDDPPTISALPISVWWSRAPVAIYTPKFPLIESNSRSSFVVRRIDTVDKPPVQHLGTTAYTHTPDRPSERRRRALHLVSRYGVLERSAQQVHLHPGQNQLERSEH